MDMEMEMGRPGRSDEHLPPQEEARIEAQARDYFDKMAPKRHTKPSRSDSDSNTLTLLVHSDSDNAPIPIPELAKFQDLQAHSHSEQIMSQGDASKPAEEYTATPYYEFSTGVEWFIDYIFKFVTEQEWRSTNHGRNNAAYRYNREGVYVAPGSRAFRDEEGKHFWVETHIVDSYRMPSGSQAPYNVTTTLLVPGNYQGDRKIVFNQVYGTPGKKRVKLPTVPVRTTGTVVVEMVDKNGLYFSDKFSLTFHMHYYKLLKWLVLLPMLAMFGMLVILRPHEGAPLPSFSRNAD